jgi:uncharacterized protein (DUF302 family)
MTTKVHRCFADTLDDTRMSLTNHGFGILTEIDIQATLKARLDVDVSAQVILGACRPPLAYAALQVEPSIGVLLPCNIVVRYLDEDTTVVEALDPRVMVSVTDNDALSSVADEAWRRLAAALDTRNRGQLSCITMGQRPHSATRRTRSFNNPRSHHG